jgi:8-oxo-dGTP pyrophosphatase MutT (NUDIX family)
MIETTSVILVRDDREYVLQHRDDLPTIADPGSYSTWGGRVEADDGSPERGAVRELREETNINIKEDQLIDLGSEVVPARSPHIKRQEVRVYYFAVDIDNNLSITVHEGQGLAVIPKPFINDQPKVSDLARWAIERYEAQA